MLDCYARYIEEGYKTIKGYIAELEAMGIKGDAMDELRDLAHGLELPEDIYEAPGELEEMARVRDRLVAKAKAVYLYFAE